jgi:hypothetical protein
MKLRLFVPFMVAFAVLLGGEIARAQLVIVKLEVADVRPVEWSRRDTRVPLWPSTTRRLQVVITAGWSRTERLGWLISSGTRVLHVFRTTGAELNDMLDEIMSDLTMDEMEPPTAAFSYGGQGAVNKPPPGDPGPAPVIPGDYVAKVLQVAADMNTHVLPDLDIP